MGGGMKGMWVLTRMCGHGCGHATCVRMCSGGVLFMHGVDTGEWGIAAVYQQAIHPSRVKAIHISRVRAIHPSRVKAIHLSRVKAIHPSRVKAIPISRVKAIHSSRVKAPDPRCMLLLLTLVAVVCCLLRLPPPGAYESA